MKPEDIQGEEGEKALKRLEGMCGMAKWISLKDQEPPYGEVVLTTDGEKRDIGSYGFTREWHGPTFDKFRAVPGGPKTEWIFAAGMKPTLWMPLPELPEREDEEVFEKEGR